MTIDFHKQKGFYFNLLASILIISISLITDLRKDLFVHESGNFKIYGGLGTLLAVGLLFRWKFIRHITVISTLIILVLISFLTFSVEAKFLMSYISLLVVLILLMTLLISKPLKEYMNSKQN